MYSDVMARAENQVTEAKKGSQARENMERGR